MNRNPRPGRIRKPARRGGVPPTRNRSRAVPRVAAVRGRPIRRNSNRNLVLGLVGGISAGVLIGLGVLLLVSTPEVPVEVPAPQARVRRTAPVAQEAPKKETPVRPVEEDLPQRESNEPRTIPLQPFPEREEEETEDWGPEEEEEIEESEEEEEAPQPKGWTIVSSRAPETTKYAPGQLTLPEKNRLFRSLQKEHPQPFRRVREDLREEHGIHDITTIMENGDPSRRIDIVIISAGFPEKAAKAFHRLAEKLKTSLLREEPFRNYTNYINVHRVSVNDRSMASTQAGARVTGTILTCDTAKARELASFAPDADLVVVLCDITDVRATGGGGVITIDADVDMSQAFLHEMGHAFGNLSDEYVDHSQVNSMPLFKDENDEQYANVSRVRNPKQVKWHYWVPRSWPAAHQRNKLGPDQVISCFEGGYYRARGIWRPQAECLMAQGDNYCAVCFEQVERKFYEKIPLIHDAFPRQPKVALWKNESIEFGAELIRTKARGRTIGKFKGLWYVDGKQRTATKKHGLTTTAKIRARELGEGTHEVALRVDFSNKRVRRDLGWLSDSRGWSLEISSFPKPRFTCPERAEGTVGEEITFQVSVENPAPDRFRLEARDLPEGAVFEGGVFRWTPEAHDQGSWQPEFRLTDGTHSAIHSMNLLVKGSAGRNFSPLFVTTDLPTAVEGVEFEWTPRVIDLDGDHLVYTCPDLPTGARLDAYTGRFTWTPGARAETIEISVTDGRKTVTHEVPFRVDRAGNGFGILRQLRSTKAATRKAALGKLGSHSDTFRLLEAARLLRDRDESVRTAALGVLETLVAKEVPALREMIIRDIAPHAWHFTESGIILKWLDGLAKEVGMKCSESSKLRSTLRKIRSYNSRRGILN